MSLEHKVKGVMNVRDEVIKQMGINAEEIPLDWERVIAMYVQAVCTREITIDEISVSAYTYSER